ncbi:MAG TPA: hypothetical protein VGL81_20630 [Polyangiaceae bacterium]|jgi:hypothetical protein
MRRLLLAATAGVAAVALFFAFAGTARAAEPFVDAPLTLPPLHFSGDFGVGFGTYQSLSVDPNNPTAAPVLGGTQVGWGTNIEAAVGLPFVGELGVRIGYRFGDGGIAAGSGAGADHFGRLFDPIVSQPGASNFANPEIHLRGTLFDLHVVQMALETRLIIPTDSTQIDGQNVSNFAITPGVPFRIHIPGFLRIDTGLYLPISFDANTSYSLDIPAQAFFTVGDAFFGPVTGIRFNAPGGGVDSSVDIPLGIGGGYTIAGRIDLKVQLRTERINDANWASQYLGGGLGVGLRLP